MFGVLYGGYPGKEDEEQKAIHSLHVCSILTIDLIPRGVLDNAGSATSAPKVSIFSKLTSS